MPPLTRLNPAHLALAFGSGGLLTLMVLFNGELARYGTPLFSSWTAHGTGTVAAIILLVLVGLFRRETAPVLAKAAPLWAYLGGVSGALTVILTGITVNTALALTGTLALGLAGQVVFSLAADRWGLFGMPVRIPALRDLLALALIVVGSLLIIFAQG